MHRWFLVVFVIGLSACRVSGSGGAAGDAGADHDGDPGNLLPHERADAGAADDDAGEPWGDAEAPLEQDGSSAQADGGAEVDGSLGDAGEPDSGPMLNDCGGTGTLTCHGNIGYSRCELGAYCTCAFGCPGTGGDQHFVCSTESPDKLFCPACACPQ